jgi:Family of unknown function (DUF5670)
LVLLSADASKSEKEQKMAVLLVIGIILVALWLLGLVSAFTLGGFIHVALVVGLILVIVWAVTGFRARKT